MLPPELQTLSPLNFPTGVSRLPQSVATLTPTPDLSKGTAPVPSNPDTSQLTIPTTVVNLAPNLGPGYESRYIIQLPDGSLVEYRVDPAQEQSFLTELSPNDTIITYVPPRELLPYMPDYSATPRTWIGPYASGTPTAE